MEIYWVWDETADDMLYSCEITENSHSYMIINDDLIFTFV